MRRLAARLAQALHGGYAEYMRLDLWELMRLSETVADILEEDARARERAMRDAERKARRG